MRSADGFQITLERLELSGAGGRRWGGCDSGGAFAFMALLRPVAAWWPVVFKTHKSEVYDTTCQ
jgi:hypothetical protein